MLYMYMYRCVQLIKVLTVVEGALRCCQSKLGISKEIKRIWRCVSINVLKVSAVLLY